MAKLARILGISVFAIALGGHASLAFADVTASFRYALSNFSGPVPSQWAKLAVDPERNEVYALNPRESDIRIFNEQGMEIYTFGDGVAAAADIAIGDDGNVYLLARSYRGSTVHRCDFRGEPVAEITLENIPASFSEFRPDRLVYRNKSLYLVDSNSLTVIVTDRDGSFERGYDLELTLRRNSARYEREKKRGESAEKSRRRVEDFAMNGFTVDKGGDMLFTVPSLFSAFRLSADGGLEEFGRAGSGRGKFGVAGGIATDDMGFIYVSDRLRCVVLVFDHSFRFQTEFGYRGGRPSNLIVPNDLAIDSRGNLYVAQAANRGVSVFKVVHEGVDEIVIEQREDFPLEATPGEEKQSETTQEASDR